MPQFQVEYDLAIIGGGPGGATLASYMSRAGKKVCLIERSEFPRFRIGESLLPYSMEIFKEIGFDQHLKESESYIEKYGAQFTDYASDDKIRFDFTLDGTATWPMAYEVERAKFDTDNLNHARKQGATVLQPVNVNDVSFFDQHVEVQTDKGVIRAKYLADASGRAAFLGKKTVTRSVNKDFNNVGLYAHFEGVERKPGHEAGDIIISLLPNKAWSWIIPFKGDRASVGMVCSSDEFARIEQKEDLKALLEQKSPSLAKLLKEARQLVPTGVEANYSQKCSDLYGKRWILIGDAGQFLDPIFSSGIHISVSSAKYASQCLLKAMEADLNLDSVGLGEVYSQTVRLGVGRFHNLLNLFYDSNFVRQMKKVFESDRMREAFTKAVAGGMWEDSNPLFRLQVL
jgi:flavin-dependent dehydrogenase